MELKKNKKAQVWIETVIYTLIGLVVIGMLLAFAKPKIDSMRDKSIIQQTISSFNYLNTKINEVISKGPENSREVQIKISKGNLVLNPQLNKISWIIDSTYKFSEPGFVVDSGNLKINTTTIGSAYRVEIFKIYSFDLSINDNAYTKELSNSPSPYFLIVRNNGVNKATGESLIDVKV